MIVVSWTLLLIGSVLLACRALEDCSLMLKPTGGTLYLDEGDDVSIICDASCFGAFSQNRIRWNDGAGEQISQRPTRIFYTTYNRGMFARLFMQSVTIGDSGPYTCAAIIQGQLVESTVNIEVANRRRPVHWPVNGGDGPRRGDIDIIIPTLPSIDSVKRRRRSNEHNQNEGQRMLADEASLKADESSGVPIVSIAWQSEPKKALPTTYPCPKTQMEESFFGTHGVFAFAITLAVAVLLLYALILLFYLIRKEKRTLRTRERKSTREEVFRTQNGDAVEGNSTEVDDASARNKDQVFVTVDLDEPSAVNAGEDERESDKESD